MDLGTRQRCKRVRCPDKSQDSQAQRRWSSLDPQRWESAGERRQGHARPKGRNVVIDKKFGSPVITKDGVTIVTRALDESIRRDILVNAGVEAALIVMEVTMNQRAS